MGMDVIGINAKDTTGEYFRASIWNWPKVMSVCVPIMREMGVDEEIIRSMSFNDGVGLDEKQAEELGKRLKEKVKDVPDCLVKVNTAKKSALGMEVLSALFENTEVTNIQIGDTQGEAILDLIDSFADFCISSGGFQVC